MIVNIYVYFLDQRILVLGAGISGITAAKTLHEAGYRNIQIIEASDRIGGRMRDATLGHFTVELGAMWVYGKGTNPIFKMALDVNLTMSESFVDNWTVRDETGKNVTEEADMSYEKMQHSLKSLNAFAKLSKSKSEEDISVKSGIRYFNWMPQSIVDDVIEAYSLDFETGAKPSVLSAQNLVIDETFEDFGNHDMLAITDKRGYSSLVRGMADSFLKSDDTRLLLNTTVESIHYYDTNVSVLTTNGDVFHGDYAIVTFSLGVLQQRAVNFQPPLPDRKQMAVDKFGMAAFTHVYVQYPLSFWDETMYLLFASKRRGRFAFWHNMNVIMPGCNILQLSLFGEDSRWAERSSDEEVITEVQKTLHSMYPTRHIPQPSGHKISRWNSDPLFHGGFSYWPTSFTSSDMDTLRAPVGRLHFAGEHLHPLHYGFVHGAYITGVEAANSVLHETYKCNKTFTCSISSDYSISKSTIVITLFCFLIQSFTSITLKNSVFS